MEKFKNISLDLHASLEITNEGFSLINTDGRIDFDNSQSEDVNTLLQDIELGERDEMSTPDGIKITRASMGSYEISKEGSRPVVISDTDIWTICEHLVEIV